MNIVKKVWGSSQIYTFLHLLWQALHNNNKNQHQISTRRKFWDQNFCTHNCFLDINSFLDKNVIELFLFKTLLTPKLGTKMFFDKKYFGFKFSDQNIFWSKIFFAQKFLVLWELFSLIILNLIFWAQHFSGQMRLDISYMKSQSINLNTLENGVWLWCWLNLLMNLRQAGAELGQAQLKLEMEFYFTSFKICSIKLV